jgi:hypothetical protein
MHILNMIFNILLWRLHSATNEMAICRTVFGRAMPVHLCTYHVATAWYKGICQKAAREPGTELKKAIRNILQDVKTVMLFSGTDMLQESQAAVRTLFAQFKQKWQHQGAVVRFFEKEWEGNIGMALPYTPSSLKVNHDIMTANDLSVATRDATCQQ